jgi:hypothetical protein
VYILNQLSLQVAQQLFVNVGRYRVSQNLSGAKDGVNTTYYTPGREKFAHNLPFFDISIYFNGSRLSIINDYLIEESEGRGTGYDTIILLVPPPRFNDLLFADYILMVSNG